MGCMHRAGGVISESLRKTEDLYCHFAKTINYNQENITKAFHKVTGVVSHLKQMEFIRIH